MRRQEFTAIRLIGTVVLAIIAATCMVPAVFGSTFESGKSVHISNLHRIDDDLYAAGEEILIEGTVQGDLTAAGYHTDIKGVVEGAANIGCQGLNHTGRIDGSLRFFAYQALLNGAVGGSVIGCGYLVNMGHGSVVERDVTVIANDVSLDGVIKGDVEVAGNNVRLSGLIEGNVRAKAGKLTIVPPAVIRGNLTYTSTKEDALDTLSGATIVGDIKWEPIEKKEQPKESIARKVAFEVSGLLAAFLFGIIVIRLFKPYAQESVQQLRERTTVSFAAGLLGMLVLIFCVVLLLTALLMSFSGLLLLSSQPPIGVIVLIFSTLMIPITSFLSVSGLVILYSSKILVAMIIGAPLLKLVRKGTGPLSKLGLLVGLVIVTLLCAIPYFGWLVYIAILLAGSGAILLGIKNCRKESLMSSTTATAINEPPSGSADG